MARIATEIDLPDRKRRTFSQFLRKYFLEGQSLDECQMIDVPSEGTAWERFHVKHRKYIALLIPFVLVQSFWWPTAIRHDLLSLFPSRWLLAITVMVGASIAGLTSEGSGAVFFPVLSIAMDIDATTSRDFSVMCQSFGMTCATFAILYMRIRIESRTVLFGTIGAIPGIVVGLEMIDPLFDSNEKKMFFVSVWGSFAIALYMLNVEKKRKTYPCIPDFRLWKAIVLVVTGFTGGIFTALAGSGVDVCLFSVITLLFRVTEKTATPTSVVLMGINTVVAFYWRAVQMGDISTEAWQYLAVAVPICSTFAPFGSFLGSHFHRQVQAVLVYILESLALIGFLFTFPPLKLLIFGAGIIVGGFLFFVLLSKAGNRLMKRVQELESAQRSRDEERAFAEKKRLFSNDDPLFL